MNHWLLWAVLAYIAVDLCVGGRMTSAAVGATTGAVRGGIAGRRAETDRILAETEGGRRTLARRQVRRRKNAAVRAGVREGVRTGARHGLDARDAWQRRAGHTVRVGGKAAHRPRRAAGREARAAERGVACGQRPARCGRVRGSRRGSHDERTIDC